MWHGDVTESNALGELGTGTPVLNRGESGVSDTERTVAHCRLHWLISICASGCRC